MATDDGISDSDATEVAALNDEIAHLRSRLADSPRRLRSLEERLLETKGQLAKAVAQNEKLSYTLRESREHISTLRDEVDKLSQPPSAYGVVVGKNDDDTVDVLTSGRKMRVALHPIFFDHVSRRSEGGALPPSRNSKRTQESELVYRPTGHGPARSRAPHTNARPRAVKAPPQRKCPHPPPRPARCSSITTRPFRASPQTPPSSLAPAPPPRPSRG